MVDFTYVSPRDRLKNQQTELDKLAALEKQNEYWAERARAELANPNITPSRMAVMYGVLNDAELNRKDIASSRSLMQAQIDTIGNEIEVEAAEKQTAAPATEYREFDERNTLGEDEQVYLNQDTSPNSDPDSAFLQDEYGQGGQDLLGSDDYGDDYSGPDYDQNVGGGNSGETSNKANPLDRYANYTYGISLHALSIEKYNNIAEGGNYSASSGEVLIASGGRKDANLSRNPLFGLDMYFDSVKINCVIGANDYTRGSNAILFDFTIIEPFSMTLVQKLVQVASQNGVNAWDQMIFLLQIDFFGNNTDGSLVGPIPNVTKYFPIRIIEIRIKLGIKGAEYQCKATPASHEGLKKLMGTTPANYEVLAKTVGEFFDAGRGGGESGGFQSRDAEAQEGGFYGDSNASKSNAIKTYSFTTAINNYQKLLVEIGSQQLADTYEFKFDGSMSNKKIVPKKQQNPFANTGARNDSNTKDNIDLEQGLSRVNAGTSILDVINLVLRQSEYYHEQITESPQTSAGSEPIKSHKVLTTIKYKPGAWDDVRKVYQSTVTYHVVPYKYYNTKFPLAKKGIPTSWSKEYDYIYTGKNQDILDLSIDFNTMFFTAITAFNQKFQQDKTSKEDQPEDQKTELQGGQDGKAQNHRIMPVVSNSQEVNQGTSTTINQVAAQDLFKSMMSSSRGDMINIKMKIAGDPDFMKQDDVFYPPGSGSGTSIPTDRSQVFVKLRFRTPEDIDQSTGLYKFSNNGDNVFTGLYTVIEVENHFERGMFTQTIGMVRLFEQPEAMGGGSGSGGSSAGVDPRDMVRGQRGYDTPLGSKAKDLYQRERAAANAAKEMREAEGFSKDADPENYGYAGSEEANDDFVLPDENLQRLWDTPARLIEPTDF